MREKRLRLSDLDGDPDEGLNPEQVREKYIAESLRERLSVVASGLGLRRPEDVAVHDPRLAAEIEADVLRNFGLEGEILQEEDES